MNIVYPEHTFAGWHDGWGVFLDRMASGEFDVRTAQPISIAFPSWMELLTAAFVG